MKTGKNLWTVVPHVVAIGRWPGHRHRALSSIDAETETSCSAKQLWLWHGDLKKYCTGRWNGLRFNGVPEMSSYVRGHVRRSADG
jgi:hypothetical protein